MTWLTRIDDPRFLTVLVTALFSAALWLATYSVMGGMDMEAMGGMEMSSGEMSQMEGMDSAGGMSSEMASDGMTMPGDGAAGMTGDMDMSVDGAMSGEMASDGMAMPGGSDMAGGMDMSGGGEMKMDGMAMDMFGMSMDPTDWSLRTIAETTVMWLLMMAAMMLPAMAPVMAVYAGVSAKEDRGARLALRISIFALSYFTLWAGFSLAAALTQLGLRSSELFTMGGTQAVPIAAGVLAIVAGAYQFTPIKHVCLTHCRHPLQYLLSHWRPGLAGAWPVGFRHGIYCFGCCVAFMGLMFVFGAMNVWWMAAIAAYFLFEKIAPGAETLGRVVGAGLIGFGLWLIIGS